MGLTLVLYQNIYEKIGVELLNNYYYVWMQDEENAKKPTEHKGALEKHLQAVNTILKNAEKRGEQKKSQQDNLNASI